MRRGFAAQRRCIFGKPFDKKSPPHEQYVISTE
jgi:hypothetical protein